MFSVVMRPITLRAVYASTYTPLSYSEVGVLAKACYQSQYVFLQEGVMVQQNV